MKVTIENKAFNLKFGFKCLMNLGKSLGLNSFNEVIQHLSVLDSIGDNFTFEQAELLENLVTAAVETHPDYYNLEYSIEDVSIVDWLLQNPTDLTKIVEQLVASLPQADVGKKKAASNSRSKKKS